MQSSAMEAVHSSFDQNFFCNLSSKWQPCRYSQHIKELRKQTTNIIWTTPLYLETKKKSNSMFMQSEHYISRPQLQCFVYLNKWLRDSTKLFCQAQPTPLLHVARIKKLRWLKKWSLANTWPMKDCILKHQVGLLNYAFILNWNMFWKSQAR